MYNITSILGLDNIQPAHDPRWLMDVLNILSFYCGHLSLPCRNTPLVSKSQVIHRHQRVKVNELVKDKGGTISQYI